LSPQSSNIEIKNLFAKKGFKTTSQRVVIYKSLIGSFSHPSAESIFESISKEHPSISLGTVYKTLDLFVEKELANKVPSKGGFSRYDGNIESHSHIYISSTNEIVDFMDDELEYMVKNYLKTKSISNLEIKNISVQINGNKIHPEKDIIVK
jgi:Fur family peroxide stress response transcriptional regulator